MFEFDEQKSRANLAKHGIDFYDAQRLWDDPDRTEVPVESVREPRWMVLAKLDGRIWAAVIAWRESRIRIISVRRARSEEEEFYEIRGV
jgi:hypothetical protein